MLPRRIAKPRRANKLRRIVSGVARRVARPVQRKRVRQRLDRIVRADRRIAEQARRAPVHADKVALAAHRRNLAKAQELYRSGKRGYVAGAFLAASGMPQAAYVAAAIGGTKRAIAQSRKTDAKEGIRRTKEQIIRRRLGLETPETRVRRRLRGKKRGEK